MKLDGQELPLNKPSDTLAKEVGQDLKPNGLRTLEQVLADMAALVPATIEAKEQKPLPLPKISNAVASKPTELMLKDDPFGQNQMTDLLAQTYALLKKYGEKADQAELRDKGFQWILGDYPIKKIEIAFREYLKTGKDIPTPADILAILDPKTQPLCKEVYIRIAQKRAKGENLDATEWAYVREYENREYKKL